MRINRRFLAGLSAALVLGCGSLAVTAPAALAATCSGTGCDGTDPYSTGCAGGSASYWVVETTPLIEDSTGVGNNSYGYVQLWWSQTCQTNWTRMVVNVSGVPAGMEEVILGTTNSRGDYMEGPETFSGAAGAHLSKQIYAGSILAASSGSLWTNADSGGVSGTELYYGYVAQPGYPLG